ncbi:MAG: hypothetical protein FJ090_00635 [Deltaproteobacteria bacterium]|nr:hypothetical protein [Deltaproteobacteria bacterium]
MGTLQTPDGPERIRGAVVLDDPFDEADASLVVVTNSPLPCEADVADDPATTRDEEAEALAWWADGVEAAAAREGAVVVAFVLPGGDGEFDIGGAGAYWLAYRVIESGWEDGERVIYEYEDDRRATGTATLAAGGDTIDVSFEVGDWSGSVSAPPCDSAWLSGLIIDLFGGL